MIVIVHADDDDHADDSEVDEDPRRGSRLRHRQRFGRGLQQTSSFFAGGGCVRIRLQCETPEDRAKDIDNVMTWRCIVSMIVIVHADDDDHADDSEVDEDPRRGSRRRHRQRFGSGFQQTSSSHCRRRTRTD